MGIEKRKPQAVAKKKTNGEKKAPVSVEQTASSKEILKEGVFPNGKTRNDIIKDSFHPTMVEFLKEKLGIDLYDANVPSSVIYDLKENRVTEPLTLTVNPTYYSKEDKTTKVGKPITFVASLRMIMPYDNNFKPLPVTERSFPFVATYPPHAFIEKATDEEMAEEIENDLNMEKPDYQKIQQEQGRFTNAQIEALEQIGIRPDRLISSEFNAIPVLVKQDILDGREFEIDGTVRTDFGRSLNVTGIGKMITLKNGEVRTSFETLVPEVQKSNMLLDILGLRKMGNIEFDFLERDSLGKAKKDINGNNILNKAARNLVKFGYSMEKVVAHIHSKSKAEPKEDVGYYNLSVVNGGLVAEKLIKVDDVNDKGEAVTFTAKDGSVRNKYHFEMKNHPLTRSNVKVVDADGRKVNIDESLVGGLRINNKYVQFVSDKDRENYCKGIGGLVKDVEWREQTYKKDKNGKSVLKTKVTVHDQLYVVPDNQRNGFPKVFSPETTKEILKLNQKKNVSRRKKQNFSMGM